jgi:hypothetical protein
VTSRNSRAAARARDSLSFYREVLQTLIGIGTPFLVGGGFAFQHYTGIRRATRDFDVFMLPEDVPATLERLQALGHRSAIVFPHWLAKVKWDDDYVDIIFSSGNGVARVDREWFDHAPAGEMLGHPLRFCPVEEMIWSKAFIMERERFDGADIAHLIRVLGASIDWKRLRARFGPHHRVLLAHLILFGYIYPQDREQVPGWLLQSLLEALEEPMSDHGRRICMGTLLSRSQYLPDLDWGDLDGRLPPTGAMEAREIAIWTEAAEVPEPHAD